MAVGTIDKAVLGAIADAIRVQAGSAGRLLPGEMAAAVAALDGSREGEAASYPAGEGRGLVSDTVFAAIADAIRDQNGLTRTYTPPEMAPAILALEWDVGLKPRAVLLEGGTLEFNYLPRRTSATGGTVVTAWEVPVGGFSTEAERGWHESRDAILRAVMDSSFEDAGVTSSKLWFASFSALAEVSGFEHLAGLSDMERMFSGCSVLQSLYCSGACDFSGVSCSLMFYGCNQLVGETGFVPKLTTGDTALLHGDGGVLVDPNADPRTWVWGAVYGDGTLEISVTDEVDGSRELLTHGRACRQARYTLATGLPWGASEGQFTRVKVLPDMQGAVGLNMCYWFYAHTLITQFEGLGNLRGVRDMNFCFASCDAVEVLDLRGFDPSGLGDLNYAFSSCGSLTTILADADWELPEGVTGAQTFYSSPALVGGNGTEWNASFLYVGMLRIDREGQIGYMTAG